MLTEESIYRIAFQLLHAAGAPDEHASTVARHLADANLAGHDSHGFIRVPQYLREINEGLLDPKAQPEVVREGKGTAKVDGHFTFGQVIATFATRLATKKAREFGISMVSMFNHLHTGRIGAYPEMAAKEGMAAIMYTGFVGGTSGNNVAPFGGRERRLGTNPISMSFPSTPEAPILLDFATSIAAEGKLRVYRARGQTLPDEWVLSKEGLPSKDPNDYYDGGSILPLGGLQGGHKGYALSFMVALFGAALGDLARLDVGVDSRMDGSSIIVIDVGALAPLDDVRAKVENVVRYVKDTPAMEGSSGVLYPGEIEAKTRQERLAKGVEVEQATWDLVVELIKEYGLEGDLGHLL
jgi:uncharacterized oxidoreductase